MQKLQHTIRTAKKTQSALTDSATAAAITQSLLVLPVDLSTPLFGPLPTVITFTVPLDRAEADADVAAKQGGLIYYDYDVGSAVDAIHELGSQGLSSRTANAFRGKCQLRGYLPA